jgi:hypothetical protein
MPASGAEAYRRSQREGPDPTAEVDATAELLQKSTALRRRMLALTIAGSLLGGAAVAALYVASAEAIYGRVTGALFAAGGLAAFAVLHRAGRAFARRMEATWAEELARRLSLSAEALKESLRMLD